MLIKADELKPGMLLVVEPCIIWYTLKPGDAVLVVEIKEGWPKRNSGDKRFRLTVLTPDGKVRDLAYSSLEELNLAFTWIR